MTTNSAQLHRDCPVGAPFDGTSPYGEVAPIFHLLTLRPFAPRMESNTPKAKRPTSVETKTVAPPVVPRIPQEIVDEILNHLVAGSDLRTSPLQTSLRSCSLVSKSWVLSSRRHLFYTVLFDSWDMVKWLKAFPVPEESPAHYVRDLRFALGWSCGTPEEFFNRTPWFTNLEKITVLGDGEFRSFGIPLSARLPQSVTSLTIHTSTVDLVQVWDIMMRLPNLDDLSLSGFGVAIYEGPLPGSGTALRGRFRGQLRLSDRHINEDLVNMLEVPTGLHFTEVYFLPMCESLSSAVRLTKACGKTLVKLSYVGSIHGKSHSLSWSNCFWHAKY